MEQAMVKASLRERYRALRRGLDSGWIQAASAAITTRALALEALIRADSVFVFVSMAGEPETRPLITALLTEGKAVHVPRCVAHRQMELVRIGGLGDLKRGYFGIEEPLPGLPLARVGEIDFALLPALACGLDGSRLGQGGGYYDRFLAEYKGESAALCFEAFVADSLPMGLLDRPVAQIITEARAIVP